MYRQTKHKLLLPNSQAVQIFVRHGSVHVCDNFTDFADKIMYRPMERLKENEDYLINSETMEEYRRRGMEQLNGHKNANQFLCAVFATAILMCVSMFCVLNLFDEQSQILIIFPIMFILIFSVITASLFLNVF